MANENFRLLSNSEFKTLEKQDALKNEKILLRKCFDCDCEIKSEKESDRQVQFTISSSKPDREKDSVSVEGWKLGNFRRSGVVLWAHQHQMPPIAKPIKTWVEDGKLKSIADFIDPADYDNHDHAKFADMIFRMYKNKVLRAVSVGFCPLKWAISEEREGGIDFQEHELLEYSGTPVPANPEALEEAMTRGIDLSLLKTWTEQELSKTDSGLFVARETLEAMHKSLSGNKTTVVIEHAKDGDTTTKPVDAPISETKTETEEPAKEFTDNKLKEIFTTLEKSIVEIGERLTKLEISIEQKSAIKSYQPIQSAQPTDSEPKDLMFSDDVTKELVRTIADQAASYFDKRVKQIKGIV